MKEQLKVLLLEDSEGDVEIIKHLLLSQKKNCVFNHAGNKQEFVQALNSFSPDVILCDHSLPQFDSSEALDIVRRRTPYMPFIMVTGTVSEEYAAGIIKQGADDYILKDRLGRLPSAIEAAIKKRKALREIADYKYALDESSIVSITDQAGKIIYVNENFCKISKYTNSELTGRDHRITSSGYHPPSFIKNLWTTIASGKIWYGEFCNKAKDGSFYWVDTTVIPFLNGKGKPYQYIALRIDITERKNNEQKILESQRRLKQAQVIAHLGSWDLNFETNIPQWSDEAYRIYGLEPGSHLSIDEWLLFVHPEDSETVSRQIEHSQQEMTDLVMDFRIVRKDGAVRYIHSESKHEFDKEGKAVGIVGIVHDVTESKKAEEELRVSEMRLNDAQAAAKISNWEIDLGTYAHTWSDELYRIFGLNKAEVQPSFELFLSLIHPDDKDFVEKKMEETVSLLDASSLNFRFIRKDNSLRYAYSKWKIILDKNEKPVRIFGILQDVTPYKKAEEALRQSEMRLNEAQSIVHISNWEVDLRQNIHTWSDEFYRIFGLNKGEVEPSLKLFSSFIHPDDAGAFRDNIHEALTSFTDVAYNFRFIRKDGVMRYGYSKFQFEFDQKGKAIRLFGILQDVTESKESEESLKALQQQVLNQKIEEQKKVTRAMIIAQEEERNHLGEELHDNVNQILAGTKLYLGMIGENKPSLKELIKYPIQLIDNSIDEIRTLCHRLAIPLKNIDLKQMVEDLLIFFSKNTAIKTGFKYSLPTLVLNDDLKLNIYRIIQEQTNNIGKHAKAKNVTVSITEKNSILYVITQDDGLGFNIDAKRKGIGISNMMHRIESYNGEIQIRSSPGNGCTITIKIPC